jgi:hypothetical protein
LRADRSRCALVDPVAVEPRTASHGSAVVVAALSRQTI